ncbi:MAG TPA: hypothetical protein VFP37_01675 [Steroidobacteraceae bacterium]|nr:hypothetical protein [Steroidobacteraceae bacterium]
MSTPTGYRLRAPVCREWRAGALALLPMAFAAAGAGIDERTHQGFSAWRSACRAAGIRLESMLVLTIDLLPAASIGLFLGVMALQFAGALLWHRPGGARVTLSAHAGCASGMAAGLLLCAFVPSVPLMLGAELLVAAGSATLFCRAGTGFCAPGSQRHCTSWKTA